MYDVSELTENANGFIIITFQKDFFSFFSFKALTMSSSKISFHIKK